MGVAGGILGDGEPEYDSVALGVRGELRPEGDGISLVGRSQRSLRMWAHSAYLWTEMHPQREADPLR